MTKAFSWFIGIALAFALLITVFVTNSAPQAGAAELVSLSSLSGGDLVRGESFSAVYYYGDDGFRYVFPNSKTFFTWYDNFDSVKWLSDSDLTKVQIGGNVTYKPGVKMIKINSDPKTYAVGENGTLRHITSEAVAISLYGANWNKMIDDVPDGFFPNYTIGTAIDDAGMFSVASEKAAATSIGANKHLSSATVITVDEYGFSPSSVTITAGTAVRFENDGSEKHGATSDTKAWGSGTIVPGGNFSRYFLDSGTYTYHDKYNTAKTGTLIVQ